MIKVQILARCEHCNGQAYLPNGEAQDYQGNPYTRYAPCSSCDGTGKATKWIDLTMFARLLVQAQCKHDHTSFQGGMHFSGGDAWDDLEETCDTCGVNLDRQTLDNFIQDDN